MSTLHNVLLCTKKIKGKQSNRKIGTWQNGQLKDKDINVQKYIKVFSLILIIKMIQIENVMLHHFLHINWVKTRMFGYIQCWIFIYLNFI